MLIKTIVACLLGMACVATLAQKPVKATLPTGGIEETSSVKGLDQVHPEQVRLVIYRAEAPANAAATSISVNDAYHTTLDKEAYREDCFAPSKIRLQARKTGAGGRGGQQPAGMVELQTEGGQSYYLRVLMHMTGPAFEAVDPERAEQDLKDKYPQMRTLSRAAQRCLPAPTSIQPAEGPAKES